MIEGYNLKTAARNRSLLPVQGLAHLAHEMVVASAGKDLAGRERMIARLVDRQAIIPAARAALADSVRRGEDR